VTVPPSPLRAEAPKFVPDDALAAFVDTLQPGLPVTALPGGEVLLLRLLVEEEDPTGPLTRRDAATEEASPSERRPLLVLALCRVGDGAKAVSSVPIAASHVTATISGIGDEVVTVTVDAPGAGGGMMRWQCQDGEEAAFVQQQLGEVARSPRSVAAVAQRLQVGRWT
jgi:hypothetical protein